MLGHARAEEAGQRSELPGGRRTTTGNALLDTLPVEEAGMLRPLLEQVQLGIGGYDSDPGDLIFPERGTVIAVLAEMADGRTAELISVGGEGAITPALRARTGHGRLLVQVPGAAWVLRADRTSPDLAMAPSLNRGITTHEQQMLTAALQGIACAALHQVEQRVARWLLTLEERAGRPDLPVTQETLAGMLGVRRTTVTRVVTNLEERGLIRHRRARLRIIDRPALEGAACECHGALRRRMSHPAGAPLPSAAVAE